MFKTSVISNLTARPSHNLIDAARQTQTIAWWTDATVRFALYGSQVLIDEISRWKPGSKTALDQGSNLRGVATFGILRSILTGGIWSVNYIHEDKG